MLEKTLESSLDCKIKSVNPKGDQPWIFMGRTGAEAEAPILWLPDEIWLTGKDPEAWKDWRQNKKGVIWLDKNTDSMEVNLSKLWEQVEDRGAWLTVVHGFTKS